MKNISGIITCFTASTLCLAQPIDRSDDQVFQIVEQMPQFPGGQEALMEYMKGIIYPAAALENNITGSVYVRFIIEKDGSVTNVEVPKGADKTLNDAAMEHVQNMPSWKPGYQNGKAVRVQYIVPVYFKTLQDEDNGKKKKKG